LISSCESLDLSSIVFNRLQEHAEERGKGYEQIAIEKEDFQDIEERSENYFQPMVSLSLFLSFLLLFNDLLFT